jgi:hypothetical protein
MSLKVRPLPLLGVAAAIALALVCALALLPHDPYLRFQQLAGESVQYLRVKWIYERIHHDPTPIDVAFVGTSHTQSGVDSELVENALAAAGERRHVVNFAVPHLGRDIQYLVVKELLASRKVQTLVLEVQQVESRAPHPGFQRLASKAELLQAPVLINTGLVENFSRLPLRELELHIKTARPAWFGLQAGFDPASYAGPHYDDTYLPHGTTKPRTAVYPLAHFAPELAAIRADIAGKEALAKRFDSSLFEENPLYRYNSHYLREIVALAAHHKVQLVFMYLPYLQADETPPQLAWFAQRGPVLVPRAVIGDPALWQNADHLNVYGARVLSPWLAPSWGGSVDEVRARLPAQCRVAQDGGQLQQHAQRGQVGCQQLLPVIVVEKTRQRQHQAARNQAQELAGQAAIKLFQVDQQLRALAFGEPPQAFAQRQCRRRRARPQVHDAAGRQ